MWIGREITKSTGLELVCDGPRYDHWISGKKREILYLFETTSS